jgi:hypothetical protein
MQLRIEDGLSDAKVRYSTTLASSIVLRVARNPSAAPEDSSALSHSVPDPGIARRQGGEALRGLDRAGEEVGALHVAREPVQVVGGSREHSDYRVRQSIFQRTGRKFAS